MTDYSASQPAGLDPKSPFTSVPIELTVCVGKARPLIRDLINMGENAVLTLDRSVDDPVDIFVGDRLIARGVLEEQDGGTAGQLVVRLTEVVDFKSGL